MCSWRLRGYDRVGPARIDLFPQATKYCNKCLLIQKRLLYRFCGRSWRRFTRGQVRLWVLLDSRPNDGTHQVLSKNGTSTFRKCHTLPPMRLNFTTSQIHIDEQPTGATWIPLPSHFTYVAEIQWLPDCGTSLRSHICRSREACFSNT